MAISTTQIQEMTAYTIHLTDDERDQLVQLIEKSGEFKRGALYSAADELTGEIDFRARRRAAYAAQKAAQNQLDNPDNSEI